MHTEDEHVRCPYYKEDGHQKIRCEGVEGGTALNLTFATAPQHRDYKRRFCRRCWGDCTIAKMLNEKYEYET